MKYLNHLSFASWIVIFFWLFQCVSIVCDSLWKYSALIFWGWSEIEPCIYSRFSVEHNITVSRSISCFHCAAGFFSGLHCFSLEHSIVLLMKIWFWQCLTGFMFCSDVYLKSVTPTLCVDCNLLSSICILYTLLVKLVRVMDCIILIHFLISLLGIIFLFQNNINI